MRTVKLGGCLLAMVAVWGCGSSNPSTYEATGTVIYNGAPIEGATVVFGAASAGGRVASGITDSAGKFSLTTFKKKDGAVPGSYTIAISKTQTTGGMSADEEHAAINAGKQVAPAKTVDLLPAKYKDGPKSGLTAEVTPAGPNKFTFELTN